MLKKRILASTMASVMALGSVSLVAFADDKVEAPKTESVSKDQLEKYLESLEDFIDNELDDYGSNLSEQFEDAYEAAQVVVDDKDTDADDATAAYQMLKAVQGKLVHHTVEELEDLVKDYKTERDSENILNDDDTLTDYIWDADTYAEFEDAYDVAKDSLEETDQRAINDAYTNLETAINNLDENDVVTRREFISTYNKFVKLAEEFENYEDWRRGKATVGVNSGQMDDDGDGNNGRLSFEGKTLEFGELKDIVYGKSNTVPQSLKKEAYNGGTAGKTDTKTTWIAVGTPNTDTVQSFVSDQRDRFLAVKSADKTTDGNIVKAYKAAKAAVEVFEGWEVDNVKKSSKSSCEKLLDDYRDDLIKTVYAGADASKSSSPTDVDKLLKAIMDKGTSGDVTSIKGNASGTVEVVLAAKKTLTFKVNTETGKINLKADGKSYEDSTGTAKTIGSVDATAAQTIDITDLLPLNATLIDTGVDTVITSNFTTKANSVDVTSTNKIDFADAMKSFESLVANETAKTPTDWGTALAAGENPEKIDTNNVVTENTGKSTAYQLVYRALAYALADAYPSEDEYSRNDVEKLLDEAEEILVITYDSATFETENTALDKVWRAGHEWYGVARKTKGYKASTAVKVDGKYLNDSSTVFISASDGSDKAAANGLTATTVYNKLNSAYKDLKKKLEGYKYSYGDIAETITEVSEGLDKKAYGASTDTIKAAAADIAYRLSTLNDTKVGTDNVFDDDRNFIAYNRLNKNGKDGEKALYKNYEALLKAMEEATAAPEKGAGDVDGDGEVTLDDAKMILDAYVGSVTLTADQTKAGDMDGDGDADLVDAQAIVNAYVGL